MPTSVMSSAKFAQDAGAAAFRETHNTTTKKTKNPAEPQRARRHATPTVLSFALVPKWPRGSPPPPQACARKIKIQKLEVYNILSEIK
eukprot:4520905-Amphidinium_carterae.2